MGRYGWDPDKALENEREHGVSFDEAETAVDNRLSRTVPDLEHSSLEDRFRTIGWSDLGRLLVVVTSQGGRRPRIISAWRATKRERNAYERR
jgi:hypothetical protein